MDELKNATNLFVGMLFEARTRVKHESKRELGKTATEDTFYKWLGETVEFLLEVSNVEEQYKLKPQELIIYEDYRHAVHDFKDRAKMLYEVIEKLNVNHKNIPLIDYLKQLAFCWELGANLINHSHIDEEKNS